MNIDFQGSGRNAARTRGSAGARLARPLGLFAALAIIASLTSCGGGGGAPTQHAGGGEANLQLPPLDSVSFIAGMVDGHTLLMLGLVVCVGGSSSGCGTTPVARFCRCTGRCWESPS